MTLFDYFLRANLCLVVFYGLYALLFRRHTFFKLNRVYLLAGLAGSLLLPLIELPQRVVQTVDMPVLLLPMIAVVQPTPDPVSPTLPQLMWLFYGMGVAAFVLRLGIGLWRLGKLIHSGRQQRLLNYRLVVLADDVVAPFSFFQYLVINQHDYEHHAGPILRHEAVHIRQKHSLDMLVSELIKIGFWFNPVAWLYQRALQQTHEYLADAEAALPTLSTPQTKAEYARFLVNFAFGAEPEPIANSFLNGSLLKARIRMLSRLPSARHLRRQYWLALPVAGILLAFTAARSPLAETLQPLSAVTPFTNLDQPLSVTAEQPGQENTVGKMTEQPGQEIIVTGRVTDAKNGPLPGATVSIANGKLGTITDPNGRYLLAKVPSNAKLIFNFVGFSPQLISVDGRKTIDVTLISQDSVRKDPGSIDLHEVIVIGYGSTTPRDTQAPTVLATPAPGRTNGEVFTVVEQAPEFPGGMVALGQYLGRNLRYPAAAQRSHVQGRVFVQFVVTDQGSIQDVQVLKGIGFGCDEEALRVVAQMPAWKPGVQSGRPVSVRYNLPVQFLLENRDGSRVPDVVRQQPVGIDTGDVVRRRITIYPNNGGSISSGQRPLYIIDGVEQKNEVDLNATLNPNEIESINVIKGEQTTALYGEKGKHGVIIIKTKKTPKKDE